MNRRLTESELREVQAVRSAIIRGEPVGARHAIVDIALGVVAAASMLALIGWVYLGCPL